MWCANRRDGTGSEPRFNFSFCCTDAFTTLSPPLSAPSPTPLTWLKCESVRCPSVVCLTMRDVRCDARPFDRSTCALGKRVGDDPATATYTCSGCATTVTGFGRWRNHMKRSRKHKSKTHDSEAGGAVCVPVAAAVKPSVRALDAPAKPNVRVADAGSEDIGGKKRKRARGPANEERRRAYAAELAAA